MTNTIQETVSYIFQVMFEKDTNGSISLDELTKSTPFPAFDKITSPHQLKIIMTQAIHNVFGESVKIPTNKKSQKYKLKMIFELHQAEYITSSKSVKFSNPILLEKYHSGSIVVFDSFNKLFCSFCYVIQVINPSLLGMSFLVCSAEVVSAIF